MALKVKDSLLQREKRILVAIDVAARKMENLSMINTLCHHFSAAHSTTTSSRNCWLEKLTSVLGKESLDGLEELVLCQKKYNQLMGYSVGPEGAHSTLKEVVASSAELKQELIKKLKANPEKREFLKNVMKRAKVFVGNDMSMHASIVGLLRSALKSKYRQHVLRCFKDMDVESLMNILFLMMPSSTSLSDEHSVGANDYLYDEITLPQQQLEPRYFTESPLSYSPESSVHSIFWDDEETVINIMEELEDERKSSHEEQLKETKIVPWKLQWGKSTEACTVQLEEDFRNEFFPYYIPSHIEEIYSNDGDHQEHFLEQEVLEIYEKFTAAVVAPYTKAVSGLISDSILYKDKSNTNIEYNDISNLVEVFNLFRSFVLLLFTRNRSKSAGEGGQSFNRMTIDLQLLSIREDKLAKRLNRIVAAHGSLQEHLNRTLMECQREVLEAKCQLDQTLRNSIKEHVTAEISLGKSRDIELSKFKGDLDTANVSLSQTIKLVGQTVKSLRARRHYLEASLESLKRHYETTMLKYQSKIDELSVEEGVNNKAIEKLQKKFKHVEETYDEMRAMKRLKQILQNMEKAEAIKQNWAARKIQVAWRKYKVAKLRKKKLKGRKKGKKKTPPPGKGGSPATKSSTPGSRSKSQTP